MKAKRVAAAAPAMKAMKAKRVAAAGSGAGDEGNEGEKGGCCGTSDEGHEGKACCSASDEGYEGEKSGRSASNEGYEGVSRRQVCQWGLHRTCLASCFVFGHRPTVLIGSRGARPSVLGRCSSEVSSSCQRLGISCEWEQN